MPPLATEERPNAETRVFLAGTAFGGIERRQNAGAFGGHRQSAESRDLCRRMTAAFTGWGAGRRGAREGGRRCKGYTADYDRGRGFMVDGMITAQVEGFPMIAPPMYRTRSVRPWKAFHVGTSPSCQPVAWALVSSW